MVGMIPVANSCSRAGDISYSSVQFKIYKVIRFLPFIYYQNSAVFYRTIIYADGLVLEGIYLRAYIIYKAALIANEPTTKALEQLSSNWNHIPVFPLETGKTPTQFIPIPGYPLDWYKGVFWTHWQKNVLKLHVQKAKGVKNCCSLC